MEFVHVQGKIFIKQINYLILLDLIYLKRQDLRMLLLVRS